MNVRGDKARERKGEAVAASRFDGARLVSGLAVDRRPAALVQRRLQEMADRSDRVMRLGALQDAVNGAARAPVVQRAEIKNKDGGWDTVEIDFSKLSAQEVADIRKNLYSLFNTEGTYKLTRLEVNALNARESVLYNSVEAQAERAKKVAEDDRVALERLAKTLDSGGKWALVGKPSHMGRSDRDFLQNWEIGIAVEGLKGVLHLHFNTNEKSEVSVDTLGKAHIKTYLESKSGNVAAPKEMVEQGIAAVKG